MIVVYILGAIFLFFLIVVAIIYNTFIYKRNVVKNIFSIIDVLLKKPMLKQILAGRKI